MKITLKKIAGIGLIPDDGESAEFINKLKFGAVVQADFKKTRNYNFHKKYFALIQFAYEHWTPDAFEHPKWEGVTPEKSFERFRKDLIILSGRYNAVYRIDGSLRIEAKSISFGRMGEEEFGELYSSTIDVILKKVLTNYTEEELERTIDVLMGYL